MGDLHRRIRRFAIPQSQLHRWLTIQKSGDRVVELPSIQDMPEDADVRGAYFDFTLSTFFVIVSHPSFDIVPEGQEAPCMSSGLTVRSISIATEATSNRRGDLEDLADAAKTIADYQVDLCGDQFVSVAFAIDDWERFMKAVGRVAPLGG